MIHNHKTWGAGILAGCLLFAIPLRADIVLSAPSIVAYPGNIGNAFELTLTNTGPSTVAIAGFNFEITASSPDITFTQATDATVANPYIFAGNSLFGPVISTSSGQTLDASDLDSAPFNAVASGASYGLALIFFNVSPSATVPEMVTVAFNQALSATSLSDSNGLPIGINTFTPGTIGVVPEPSGALLAAAGLAILSAALIRRRQRA